MKITKLEFYRLLCQLPKLTAIGFIPVDDPRYYMARERLLDSFREFEFCIAWLIENGIPDWIDTSLQLKQHIQGDSRDYIPHGCAVLASMMICVGDVDCTSNSINYKQCEDYHR